MMSHDRTADRIAMFDVLQRYCWYVDTNRPGLLALECFTADCRANYGAHDDGWVEGREALSGFVTSTMVYLRTHHHIGFPVVAFDDDDTAASRTTLTAWHERPDGSTWKFHGWYEDRWQRASEGWQISERRMIMAGAPGRRLEGLLAPPRRQTPVAALGAEPDRHPVSSTT